MYLALGWLIGLSLAMWIAICSVELLDCSDQTKHNQYKGFIVNLFESENITSTIIRQESSRRKSIDNNEERTTALIHYAMFFAGAFAVFVFNRKNEIMLYTKTKIIHINTCATKFLNNNVKFKRTAFSIRVAILKFIVKVWEYCDKSIKSYFLKRKALRSHLKIQFELFKKIKEYGEERKNLGKLLISVIRENKNIRMLYQIETNAKSRLMRYVEDTQKQIKENRSKYVSFQHLYLVTHQENIFLKARLKKLRKEKEETEKNLIDLVNEVYHSTDSELKVYCSRFIVRTRDNLLNSDVNKEIQKFLQKSSAASTSSQDTFEYLNLEADSRTAEVPLEESRILLISDVPKLKGLPGECIWTVKDKDGLIEKLYEYDYETNADKGDIISRIRKYSVYHDQDCLLDFENSKRMLGDLCSSTVTLHTSKQYVRLEYPTTNQKFLTGSQAFKRFLKDNQNLAQISIPGTPVLLSE